MSRDPVKNDTDRVNSMTLSNGGVVGVVLTSGVVVAVLVLGIVLPLVLNKKRTCDAGTYLRVSDNVCLPAPAGSYVPAAGSLTYISCPLGTSTNGETGAKVCAACASGTYADDTGSSVCHPCDTCTVGQREKSSCSAKADTLCVDCKKCGAGQYVIAPCDETHETRCGTCTTCTSNQYVHPECGGHTDAECHDCTVCAATQYSKPVCSETADAKCYDCTVCSDQEFEDAACTATKDAVCKVCTTCTEGQYTTAACGKNTDAHCADCTTCLDTQYSDPVCGGAVDGSCHDCSACEVGTQYTATACTSTADTACKDCTVCKAGTQYSKAKCTATSDADCADCTVCGGATPDVYKECTSTTDRGCYESLDFSKCLSNPVGTWRLFYGEYPIWQQIGNYSFALNGAPGAVEQVYTVSDAVTEQPKGVMRVFWDDAEKKWTWTLQLSVSPEVQAVMKLPSASLDIPNTDTAVSRILSSCTDSTECTVCGNQSDFSLFENVDGAQKFYKWWYDTAGVCDSTSGDKACQPCTNDLECNSVKGACKVDWKDSGCTQGTCSSSSEKRCQKCTVDATCGEKGKCLTDFYQTGCYDGKMCTRDSINSCFACKADTDCGRGGLCNNPKDAGCLFANTGSKTCSYDSPLQCQPCLLDSDCANGGKSGRCMKNPDPSCKKCSPAHKICGAGHQDVPCCKGYGCKGDSMFKTGKCANYASKAAVTPVGPAESYYK